MESLKNVVTKLEREPQLLKLVIYPNLLLSEISQLVTSSIANDENLQTLLDDMVFTMDHYKAAGLAAVQVGVPLRALIVRGPNGPVKVVNPTIKSQSTEQSYEYEGCLSFPALFMKISRPAKSIIQYFDENGNVQTLDGDGVLGRAILHEIDHLDGKTFLDRLSKFHKDHALKKFSKIKKKMKKFISIDSY